MSTRGMDFPELWIERNLLPRAAGEDQAERLALKLANDLVVEGLRSKSWRVMEMPRPAYVTLSCMLVPGD